MSSDTQRISDKKVSDYTNKKKEHIKEFVKKWMDEHEPGTFVKNEHGNYIYSAGHSSLNLVSFFEFLLEDYIDELGL